MKYLFIFMTLVLSISAKGQSASDTTCYVIEFRNKNILDSAIAISPLYQPKGFYLVNNGVYDLIIDGKKYFQSILLKVEKDHFYIAQNWESEREGEQVIDTLKFSIRQKIQLRLVTINNGVGGLPFRTKMDDYVVSTLPAKEYCKLKHVKMNTRGNVYLGHFYFTAYGFKEIKMVKGKAFLVEPNGEYIIRRN